MKIVRFTLVVALLCASKSLFATCHDLLNFEAKKLRETETINFCQAFSGKALLVVNTASQCGFTPQFQGLEALHQEYGDQLAIVGFPSNDFMQEYSDEQKISDVCYINYGVTFTMLEPTSVRGSLANSLFKELAERTGQEPSWNFNKYLISADGEKVTHFPSNTAPDAEDFINSIKLAIDDLQ